MSENHPVANPTPKPPYERGLGKGLDEILAPDPDGEIVNHAVKAANSMFNEKLEDQRPSLPNIDTTTVGGSVVEAALGDEAAAARRTMGFAHTDTERSLALDAAVLEARTDPLTKLENRRAFEERCEELNRAGEEYYVVVADVTRLKYVNDKFGHDAGDDLIVAVAGALRSSDTVFRTGGDEFFAIVTKDVDVESGQQTHYKTDHRSRINRKPRTMSETIEAIEKAIVERVESVTKNGDDKRFHNAGIAVGVAAVIDGQHKNAVRTADSLMYEKKAETKKTEFEQLEGPERNQALLTIGLKELRGDRVDAWEKIVIDRYRTEFEQMMSSLKDLGLVT